MNDDMMNDKTIRSNDPRFDRIGGDIERLSDTLQRIERNELDKKIGLEVLVGFAENLIRNKMTPKELNEYLAVVDEEVAQREAAEKADLALAASAAAVTNERLHSYIKDNSCCVTFDIDADNDSIVAQVRQSECAGGEVDESAVVEFNEIVSEPLDSGSLSAEEKSRKEARFLEGLFNRFVSTAGDSSKGFSMMGRSAETNED